MPQDDTIILRRPLDASRKVLDPIRPKEPQPKNIIQLVVTPKKTKRAISHPDKDYPLAQTNLIKLTEKLAADARSGKLKGLGGFAEYEDGYVFGLEGSYLVDPSAAALPLLQLQGRIMEGIKEQEE